MAQKLGKNPFQLLESFSDDENDENDKKQTIDFFDVCIYHAPCKDGLASAWIVQKLRNDIQLVKCMAGFDPRENGEWAGKSVLFVDIAPSLEYLQQLCQIAKKVTIIDHHATTMEMVQTLGAVPPNFLLIHDEKKSASELVWEHFHPMQPTPWFIHVIGDRDLFRQAPHIYPYSHELSAALYDKKYVVDFAGLDKLAAVSGEKVDSFKQKLIWDGTMIVRKRNELIREYLHSRLECQYRSNRIYRIWMYECPEHMISDVGNALMNTRFKDGGLPDFVFTWYYDLEAHKFWVAFRSIPGKTEVHQIARELSPSGGGHRCASGCCLPGGTELRTIFQPI